MSLFLGRFINKLGFSAHADFGKVFMCIVSKTMGWAYGSMEVS